MNKSSGAMVKRAEGGTARERARAKEGVVPDASGPPRRVEAVADAIPEAVP